ncbi:MAG TPA: hypothetical protein VFS68_00620 [Candidatus Udaeobacter sp.]|jgi:hypothetical protein|nr:hypothetical protein [Candidatus Udaeobacter sp.]
MKQFKLSSKRKSSGQVVVLLIIVLALLGGAWWWLNSSKQDAAREGTDFAKEAVQKIAVQHDGNFFVSRLSPQMRMAYAAPTAQQEFMNEIAKLGAPVRPPDVQGKIEFNSQFFEPHGSFHARIYYPAKYADMDITISHPVGRWQIDQIAFIPQMDQPGMPAPAVAPQTAPAPQAPATSPGVPPPQAPPASTGGPQAPPASTAAPGA